MTDVITWLWEQGARAGAVLVPLLVIILYGAIREWWVWGYVYRKEVKEKEYWREKALHALGLAERSVETAAEVIIKDAVK